MAVVAGTLGGSVDGTLVRRTFLSCCTGTHPPIRPKGETANACLSRTSRLFSEVNFPIRLYVSRHDTATPTQRTNEQSTANELLQKYQAAITFHIDRTKISATRLTELYVWCCGVVVCPGSFDPLLNSSLFLRTSGCLHTLEKVREEGRGFLFTP